MGIRLVQIQWPAGERSVVALPVDGGSARILAGVPDTRTFALDAISRGQTLQQALAELGNAESIDLHSLPHGARILPPIDHPDPAHLYLTGTGLTHLGSAEGRDQMHRQTHQPEQLTDSMRMFRMGVEGGKPPPGKKGVQPEWFYKGDGSCVVASGEALTTPHFALDGGEEPELCGIYLIGPDRVPYRLGFCLANEFSDHVMERQNYLYLAHSKLRQAALGAELLIGDLPIDVRGTSRILRAGRVIWERAFLSGERNMSHTVANLEHHHFKYEMFRRPGDVHVHFFGTATLSCVEGVVTEPGDVFEIAADPFELPLRNVMLHAAISDEAIAVRVL